MSVLRRSSLRASRLAGLALLAVFAAPSGELVGQVRVEDLVFTGGLSVEGYNGNFTAVTVPIVDSTDHASAAVGEFGARGSILLLSNESQVLRFQFDSGMRQFAAAGFELRDYAPREWVGRASLAWTRDLASGDRIGALVSGRGRDVTDRPPMPLFLQPGYATGRVALRYRSRPLSERLHVDAEIDVQAINYQDIESVSQLDLLDRDSRGIEVGAAWTPPAAPWQARFYTGFRATDYPRQNSFDPADPYRRDGTFNVGATWSVMSSVFAELGVEGVLNRSNSQRPEYDAVSLRGELSARLPVWELGLNASAVITEKSYVDDIPYARLVPGEEADNASVVYVGLQRALAPELDGALRFGWTRAETDIGAAYYSRFGLSFLLNYRPRL